MVAVSVNLRFSAIFVFHDFYVCHIVHKSKKLYTLWSKAHPSDFSNSYDVVYALLIGVTCRYLIRNVPDFPAFYFFAVLFFRFKHAIDLLINMIINMVLHDEFEVREKSIAAVAQSFLRRRLAIIIAGTISIVTDYNSDVSKGVHLSEFSRWGDYIFSSTYLSK